jgi:hypothetical protein
VDCWPPRRQRPLVLPTQPWSLVSSAHPARKGIEYEFTNFASEKPEPEPGIPPCSGVLNPWFGNPCEGS